MNVRQARPGEFPAGVQVAVAAKRATGVPFDVDEATLRVALPARQAAANRVWLAFDDGVVIGHALVAVMTDDDPTWGPVTDPAVVSARRSGRLLELGALSVHPDHHRRGVARELQRVRLLWADRHGLVPVAAAWDDSPGSTELCRQAGRPVGVHPRYPITLFVLDRRTAA